VLKHPIIGPLWSNIHIFSEMVPDPRCEMKIQMAILVLFAVVTVSLFVNSLVYAQSTQVTNNVSLRFLNVQLSYPSQALPGQSVTVNVQATAKTAFQLSNLLLQVYVADPNSLNLRELISTTVAQGLEMSSGGQISKAIQVAVPADAPRTSLIARVSENVTLTVFIVYINSNPSVQPAPYNTAASDDAISPLTYIAATTPEYTALQSQYQTLQTQNQQTQQSLSQSLAQILKLQGIISQQNATNYQLNEQLTYANRRVQTYQGTTLGFGILTVAFLSLYIRQRRMKQQHSSTALVQSKTEPAANPQHVTEKLESKPKRELNLKKISVAAIAILIIIISGWMIAGYYSTASTATQTNASTSGPSTMTNANTTSGQTGHTSVTVTSRTSATSHPTQTSQTTHT
jgi:hypothetical protein